VVEFDDSLDDSCVRFRLYGPGVDMPLAIEEVDPVPPSLGIIWTMTDHQGTVRDLAGHWVDDTFRVEHVPYTAFGVPTFPGGLPGAVRTFYAGRDLDRFTGLYNNRARWYDAGAGRFLSEDSLSFAAGDANLYRYCGNSPTNATDPSGHIVNAIAGFIGAGVGAVLGGGGYALNCLLTGAEFNGTDFFVAAGAGAASGALAGFTFGGSLLVQGAAMGATYGAINSGGTTLAHGGSLADAGYAAFQGAAIGAAAGAVGGAVAGGVLGRAGHNFVGYAASGFASGVGAGGVGGGLGGYMQTGTLGGTLSGAGLGALEGGILGGAAGTGIGAYTYYRGTFGGVRSANPSRGVDYDAGRLAGPNPNKLRQRVVSSPTAGEGGVYLKPQGGRTKIGSTNDFRGRYGPSAPDGIEVEVPLTRRGPAAEDSAYRWTARRQARFDEEYLDRITPPNVRYRDPSNPRSPVDPAKWEQYRHIFGYGDLPTDFGL